MLPVVYVIAAIAGPLVLPHVVRFLSALQRERFRALLGVEIAGPGRRAGHRLAPDRRGRGRTGRPGGNSATTCSPRVLGGLGGAAVVFCWSALVLAALWNEHARPGCRRSGGSAAPRSCCFAAPWVARGIARADTAAARRLLGPGRAEELAQRVESLARSRAELVAAADAERRRIERDLHDGAQQRLVSLAMNLGMARAAFTDMPPEVPEVIAAAHDEATAALAELRDFVRGLHPAVLNDRGLDAALSGIVARAPLPVKLRVDVAQRCSPSIEAIAYFAVSEALTNVAKHAERDAGPRSTVERVGDRLFITVTDDGRGGASVDGAGSGLRGLAQRAAAVDGTLTVVSPARRADNRYRGSPMRVVLAEDSVLLRAGLTKLLTDGGFEVVAAVPDADQLLAAVDEHRPDVVVVDVRMPPTHTDEGIRAALVIRRQHPKIAVCVLSQYVEERYATDLLSVDTSGVGYLLKDRVAHVSRLPRRAAPGRRRRHRARPGGRRPAAGAPARQPAGPADPARAGRAAADGGGPLQHRHHRGAEGQPQRGGEVRQQHLHQARPAADRHRPPPRARRAQVPRHVIVHTTRPARSHPPATMPL